MSSVRKSSTVRRGCRWPLMVVMLAISGPALARDPSATPGPPASPNQDAVSRSAPSPSPLTFAPGKTSSGWLPFEFVAGTRIFIAATINGRPVLAMLDSGASSTVLDRRFATSLGLTPKGDLTGEGAGGSTPYGIVHGVDLKLGDLDWKGGAAVGNRPVGGRTTCRSLAAGNPGRRVVSLRSRRHRFSRSQDRVPRSILLPRPGKRSRGDVDIFRREPCSLGACRRTLGKALIRFGERRRLGSISELLEAPWVRQPSDFDSLGRRCRGNERSESRDDPNHRSWRCDLRQSADEARE